MMLMSFYVAHVYGNELFGILGLILTGVHLITMIGDGFNASIVRFVSRESAEESGQESYLGWKLCWLAISVLIPMAILMGVGLKLFGITEIHPGWIILAVLVSIVRVMRAVFESCLRALRNFRDPAIWGSFFAITVALTIALVTGAGHGVSWYLSLLGASLLLNSLFLVHRLRRRTMYNSDSRGFREKYREFGIFVIPMIGRDIVGFVFLKFNFWILGWWGTLGEIGEYRLAEQFLTIAFLVFSAFLNALVPRMAYAQQRGQHEFEGLIARTYGLILAVTIPLVFTFIIGSYLVNALFPEFPRSGLIILLMAPLVAFRGIGNVASVMMVQSGHSRPVFWLALTFSAVNIAISAAGYHLYGIIGLTLGTVGVHVLSYISSVIVGHRILNFPLSIRFQ